MGNQKIVVASLHKTGTRSITKFFEKLGYIATGPDTHLFYDLLEKDFSRIDYFIERYDVFQDDPWYLLYDYVREKHPNTAVIYIERDEDSWLRSVQNYYGKTKYIRKIRKILYGTSDPVAHPMSYLKTYRNHKKKVLKFGEDRGNFLSVRIESDEDALKLQRFLGREITLRSFPHHNRTPKNDGEWRMRKQRMSVKSFFKLNEVTKNLLRITAGESRFQLIRDEIRYFKARIRSIRRL